jgi:hypothetical protein
MQHHAQTGAIAAAAATLAASLPDPHQPTIILFLAGVGALVGTAVGRIRQLPRRQIREIAEDASFTGGIIGAVLYLAALVEILGGTLRGDVIGAILTLALAHLVMTTWRR